MVKTKIHWYCSSCTKESEGSEPDTMIEFFINKYTNDPEFQGQHQFYKAIERIGVCYACCEKAMQSLGMGKTIATLLQMEKEKAKIDEY